MSRNREKDRFGWILGHDLQDNPDGVDGHSTALGYLTIWITLTIGVAASNFNSYVEKQTGPKTGPPITVEIERRDPWRSLPFYWLLTGSSLVGAVTCLRVRDNKHSISRHFFDTATVSLLRFSFWAGIMIASIASVLILLNFGPGQVKTQRTIVASTHTFKSDGTKGIVILHQYKTDKRHIEQQRTDFRYDFLIRFGEEKWLSENWTLESAFVYSGKIDADTPKDERVQLSVTRYELVPNKKGNRYEAIRLIGFDEGQPLTIEFRFSPKNIKKMSPTQAIQRLKESSKAFYFKQK